MKILENKTFSNPLLILMCMIIILIMAPASIIYAADTAYDYQPENAKENNLNSLKMLEPSDISFISKENGKYINRINGSIDGTQKDGIKFSFALTSGMKNFDEGSFLERNMPLITIYDEDGNIAAEYSEGNGELHYLGNKYENEIREIYIGVDQSVLDSGDYQIVFGRNICGNNTEKILGSDIVFNFHVKNSPGLSSMIEQAEDFVETARISETEPGCYPQSAINELKSEIQTAKEKLGTTEEEQASEALYQALKKCKNQQIFKISSITIGGVAESVSVGDSGKASASVSVEPNEDQYKKVTWSVVRSENSSQPADNIIIDEKTGRWTAAYAGTVYLKAQSTRDSEACTYKKAVVESPEGVVAVTMSDKNTRLKTMVEKTGVSAADVTSISVFTTGTGELVAEDINYLKSLEKLQNMDLSNAYLQTVPSDAFSGHIQIRKVKLPETVTSIGAKAFYGCTSLEEITVPSSVTVLGSSVFAKCTSMPETLIINAVNPPVFPEDRVLGSNIKKLQVPYSCAESYKSADGWKSFSVTESKQQKLSVEVNVSGGLEAATEKALKNLNITDAQVTDLYIYSPDGVQLSRSADIDGYLKSHFINATTIDLSETELESNKCNANTFKNRINLKYMILPETTINIGNQSFYGCRNLKRIDIPESVESIGDGAFGGCESLDSRIIINAVIPPVSNGSAFPYQVNTIVVPPESIENYENSSSWTQFNVVPQMEIGLSSKSISIDPFGEKTIAAKVVTYGNCGNTIFWKSSNPNVVEIYKSDGSSAAVRAIKTGTATITAHDVSGNVKAQCKVTVKALSVSASSAAYNKIKISWSGISGAEKYYVHRYSSSGKLIESWNCGSKTSFTDTGLTTGTTYYYKVSARKTGYAGVYSSMKTAKPALSRPGAPSVSRISSKYVKVKWKGISGETGYQVYRATSKNGKYSKVASVKMASYKYPYAKIMTNRGKTYYYKVRAYKKIGSKTVYSSFSSYKAYKLK